MNCINIKTSQNQVNLVNIESNSIRTPSLHSMSVIVDNILKKNGEQPIEMDVKMNTLLNQVNNFKEKCKENKQNNKSLLFAKTVVLVAMFVFVVFFAPIPLISLFPAQLLPPILVATCAITVLSGFSLIIPGLAVLIASIVALGMLSFIPATLVTLLIAFIAYKMILNKKLDDTSKLEMLKLTITQLENLKEGDKKDDHIREQLLEYYKSASSPIELELKKIIEQKEDLKKDCDTAIEFIMAELESLKTNSKYDENIKEEEYSTLNGVIEQLQNIKTTWVSNNKFLKDAQRIESEQN